MLRVFRLLQVTLVAVLLASSAGSAEEVRLSDGRLVEIKPDGTWVQLQRKPAWAFVVRITRAPAQVSPNICRFMAEGKNLTQKDLTRMSIALMAVNRAGANLGDNRTTFHGLQRNTVVTDDLSFSVPCSEISSLKLLRANCEDGKQKLNDCAEAIFSEAAGDMIIHNRPTWESQPKD